MCGLWKSTCKIYDLNQIENEYFFSWKTRNGEVLLKGNFEGNRVTLEGEFCRATRNSTQDIKIPNVNWIENYFEKRLSFYWKF